MSYSKMGKIFNKLIEKKEKFFSRKIKPIIYDFYLDEEGNKIINKGINIELKKQKLKNFLEELSRSDEDRNLSRKKYLNELISNKQIYSFQKEKEKFIKKREMRIKNILEERHKKNNLSYSPNYNAIFPNVHYIIFPKSFEKNNNKINNDNERSFNEKKEKKNKNFSEKNLKPIKSKENKNIIVVPSYKEKKNRIINNINNDNSKKCTPKKIDKLQYRNLNKKKNKSTLNLFRKKISMKFKPIEPFFCYTPNFEFIKEDTSKTFVHYGRDYITDLRNKKIKNVKKKICSNNLLNASAHDYAIIDICNEENRKKEEKKKLVKLMYNIL